MLYYLIPLSVFFLFSQFEYLKNKTSKRVGLAFVFFLPLFLIVIFRGNVGTDTATYIEQFRIRLLGLELDFGSFEPGFEVVASVILHFTNDPTIAVNILSGFNAVIFFVVIRMWGGNLLFAAACIFPAYFFDYTMNGLRIGLAFSFCLLSYMAWERKKFYSSIIFLLLAVSFQITSIVLFALLMIQQLSQKIRFKKIALIFIPIALIYFFLGDFLIARVLEKINFYEYLKKPNATSGWFPLGASLILLMLSFVKNKYTREPAKIREHLFYFLAQFLFFQLTLTTYAGIRFQLIGLFAHLLFSQRFLFPILNKKIRNIFMLNVLFIIYSAWKIRSFIGEGAEGTSPFLPYHFFWNS